jgi:hypothetical protein
MHFFSALELTFIYFFSDIYIFSSPGQKNFYDSFADVEILVISCKRADPNYKTIITIIFHMHTKKMGKSFGPSLFYALV